MTSRFIDTNVLLRYLMQDHADQSPRATRLFDDIAKGQLRAHISDTVIFETLFTMSKTYAAPRSLCRDALRELLRITNLILPTKSEISEAMDLWVDRISLSFADCYHLVLTKSLGLTEIYSFDKKMGRYPGVTRVEP